MAKLIPTMSPSSNNDFLEPTWKRVPRNITTATTLISGGVSKIETPGSQKKSRYSIQIYSNYDMSNYTSVLTEDLVFYKEDVTKTFLFYSKENVTTQLIDDGLQLLGFCYIARDQGNNIQSFTLMIEDDMLSTQPVSEIVQPTKLWYFGNIESTSLPGFVTIPNQKPQAATWYVDIATINYQNSNFTIVEPHNKLYVRL